MLLHSTFLYSYIEALSANGGVTKPDMSMIEFVNSYQKAMDRLNRNIAEDKNASATLKQVSTLRIGRDGKTNPGGQGIGE